MPAGTDADQERLCPALKHRLENFPAPCASRDWAWLSASIESSLQVLCALSNDQSPLRRLLRGSAELHFMHHVVPNGLRELEADFHKSLSESVEEIDQLVVASKAWNSLIPLFPHISATLSRIKMSVDEDVADALAFLDQQLVNRRRSEERNGSIEVEQSTVQQNEWNGSIGVEMQKEWNCSSGKNSPDRKQGTSTSTSMSTPTCLRKSESGENANFSKGSLNQREHEEDSQDLHSQQRRPRRPRQRGNPAQAFLQRRRRLVQNFANAKSVSGDGKRSSFNAVEEVVSGQCNTAVPSDTRRVDSRCGNKVGPSRTPDLICASNVYADINRFLHTINEPEVDHASGELSSLAEPRLVKDMRCLRKAVHLLRKSIRRWSKEWAEVVCHCWWVVVTMHRILTQHHLERTMENRRLQQKLYEEKCSVTARIEKLRWQLENRQKKSAELNKLHPQLSLQLAQRSAQVSTTQASVRGLEKSIDLLYEDYQRLEDQRSRNASSMNFTISPSSFQPNKQRVEGGSTRNDTGKTAAVFVSTNMADETEDNEKMIKGEIDVLKQASAALGVANDLAASVVVRNQGRNAFMDVDKVDSAAQVNAEKWRFVRLQDASSRWEDVTTKAAMELGIQAKTRDPAMPTSKAGKGKKPSRFKELLELRKLNLLWRLVRNTCGRNPQVPASFAHLMCSVSAKYHARPTSLAATRCLMHTLLADFAAALVAQAPPLWMCQMQAKAAATAFTRVKEKGCDILGRGSGETLGLSSFLNFVYTYFSERAAEVDVGERQLLDFLRGAMVHHGDCDLLEYFCGLTGLEVEPREMLKDAAVSADEHIFFLSVYSLIIHAHDGKMIVHQPTGQIYYSTYTLFEVMEDLLSFCMPKLRKKVMEQAKALSFRINAAEEYLSLESGAQIGPLYPLLILLLNAWRERFYNPSSPLIDALFQSKDYTNRGIVSKDAVAGMLTALEADAIIPELDCRHITHAAFRSLLFANQLLTAPKWHEQRERSTFASIAHREGVKTLPADGQITLGLPTSAQLERIAAGLFPCSQQDEEVSRGLPNCSELRIAFSQLQNMSTKGDEKCPAEVLNARVAMWMLQWELEEAEKKMSAEKHLRSLKYMLKWKALFKRFGRTGVRPRRPPEEQLHPVFSACRWGKEETFRRLLNGGVSVDMADDRGNTLLHYAVQNNHPHFVKMLIQQGANSQAVNHQGNTCEDMAKRFAYKQCLFVLTAHGRRSSLTLSKLDQ